jgi:predicted phosphoribosyltransferase
MALSLPPLLRDRSEAGQVLARHLSAYKDRADVVVLALPRGGVPVAYEVARALAAPLDIFLVRKLGVPGHEELEMGAIASGGQQPTKVVVAVPVAAASTCAASGSDQRRKQTCNE